MNFLMNQKTINFQDFNNTELITLYGKLVKELRKTKIIRTKNIVGDLGERFAIDYYSRSKSLESLTDAPTSSKSIDAIGENGNKYAIKSITGNITGVFYGLPHLYSDDEPDHLFDFLLIVKFNDSYEVLAIYELNWNQFLEHKKWHTTMQSLYMPLNQKVISDANIRYEILH